MVRVESPSSINTYNQCPRKYYYHYIEELPTTPSIHLVRGNIVHTVLEEFFDIDDKIKTQDDLQVHLFWLLEKVWNENQSRLLELGLDEKKLAVYYEDSRKMLQNWLGRFRRKLKIQVKDGMTFDQAFESLTPIREQEFVSEKYKVRGFIDAMFEKNGNTVILDYKTSKRNHLSPEYRLQLGIYALMYLEKTGKLPAIVGIDFLAHNEVLVPVDEKLIDHAKEEVTRMHKKTVSKEKKHYPKKPSPLCKWSTGQCDYYDKCFKY
ncbi:MAG: PD-(D/E)XK nuclease family protein [archaeon]